MSSRHAIPRQSPTGVLGALWAVGSGAVLALLGVLAADSADAHTSVRAPAPDTVPDQPSGEATSA
ncbi:hypothetical protein [Streptomyces boncukensis]|uniref:Uncharacterized protein n=1 Tax=Streptomyces boncukensis TaxID=2711219 RepID=A0A6G4X1Y0_9ACTN|nr:hypothetical protein [Streptomyces boncukensis]NGO70754.1 hypothetical protein [Streptomyces boncukensis]